MRILIAPDKFKDSLTAQDVCSAIETGLVAQNPELHITKMPLADGGEGSLELIERFKTTERKFVLVKDPLGRSITSSYLISGKDAYIEVAAASGLMHLSEEERNPLFTTTYGTGELIMDAIFHDAENIYLMLGGSATTDMGIGIAEVLGYRFLDKDDHDVPPVGVSLPFIMRIESKLNYDSDRISFYAVCDVNNILHGEDGAAYVYAGQKGADEVEIEILDRGLKNLAKRSRKYLGKDIAHIPGTGAAGGIGGGVMAFLNGEIISGTDFTFQISKFEDHVKNSDIIITGEGKLDHQSLQGKTVSGVTKIAKKYDVPVYAFTGISELNHDQIKQLGLTKVLSISELASDREDAIANAFHYLQGMAHSIF